MRSFIVIVSCALVVGCSSSADESTGTSVDPAGGVTAQTKSGGGGSCIDLDQGGPTSCKDDAAWKAGAIGDCSARGLLMVGYSTYEDCGKGLHRHVKYECCKGPLATCPWHVDDVPLGTACIEPLVCDYVDACGVTDQLHCKVGTWQINTWHSCP